MKSSAIKKNSELSPIFSPNSSNSFLSPENLLINFQKKPLIEEFNSSIQKNTTNESYSLTEKGTIVYTTSNKKIKSSFVDDFHSNGKVEPGNIIEFEEFVPMARENINITGNFGVKNFEDKYQKNSQFHLINQDSRNIEDNKNNEEPNKKNSEISYNFVKDFEKKNEFLIRENDDLKKRLQIQSKEMEGFKENLMKYEKNNAKIEKKNEELLKEILVLKQNLIEMNQKCKDSDIQNIRLKEEIESRGDKIQQLLDKNKTLEKELLRKEQKIENLNKETQNNWNSNDNDGLMQKNLMYCEKINQMSNLIDAQKQVLSKNEKKTDSLLRKLDELTGISNTKSSEISKLKYENLSLRDEIENLQNKVFIKDNEKTSNNYDKNQLDLIKKEKMLSMLDENLENFENNKMQKLKKYANKSNHLTHASLNFELNGPRSLMHNSEIKERDENKIQKNEQNEQINNNMKFSKFDIPLQSPKQMIKNNSQKNLSLNRVSETGKEKKNKQSNLSNEKHHQKQTTSNPPQQNYFMDIEKLNNETKNLKDKNMSPNQNQASSSSLIKPKEKKSLADLNNLVNQITNRRPPKIENCSNNTNNSKIDVSGKTSNISKSNKSSNSLKYSMEMGAQTNMLNSRGEIKSNTKKSALVEKENLAVKTERVPSSEFKNFNNIKAPQKMFGNKNAILMNNYLKSTARDEDFEDFLKKQRNYNI